MKLNIQRQSRKEPGILLIIGPTPLGKDVEIRLTLERKFRQTFDRPLVHLSVYKGSSVKAYWQYYFPPGLEERFIQLDNLKGAMGIPGKAKKVIRAILEDPDQLLPWVVLLTTQPGRRHGLHR